MSESTEIIGLDPGAVVGIEATVQRAQPGADVPAPPVSFADTPYDVLTDVTLPDGRVIGAGSTTTPAEMHLADNIPAVHARVVAGQIWPTGVGH